MFSIAPMMDWTDRHCRYFHRQLAPSARLYTEMVHARAVIHGDRDHLLTFDAAEHPVALQLGGAEPDELARAAAIGEQFGYDEINLNAGCPSDRVQRGRFGACLMKEGAHVRECLAAMRDAATVPVTVKTRIGVDEYDSDEFLIDFVGTVAESGIGTVVVHARKAWLSGLSPKKNREIPPLHYDRVHRLKAALPDLAIVINGGIRSVDDAKRQLGHVDGVMLGRAAYQNPWLLTDFERTFGAGAPPESRLEVLEAMIEYAGDKPVGKVARHMLGLYQGRPGARRWRQVLSREMHRADTVPELLLEASPETGPRVRSRAPARRHSARV